MRWLSKLAATLALVGIAELSLFSLATRRLLSSPGASHVPSEKTHWPQQPARRNNLTVAAHAPGPNDPCVRPRRPQWHQANGHMSSNGTVVYLETAHVNLHYETYYTFIHTLCSCDEDKGPHWTIDNGAVPRFYVGPRDMLTAGFERILGEYNATVCGPILLGTPPPPSGTDSEGRRLTIVTTSYPDHFAQDHPRGYHRLVNDPRYLFICHEDAGNGDTSLEENASNVFFLTPLHERHIVPSYFPPSFVQRHSRSLREQHPEKPAIFLVLGSFDNPHRRNVRSLAWPLKRHRDANFVVLFLGGASSGAISNEHLRRKLLSQFDPEVHKKIEFLPRTDADEFMLRVSESDVILPLVDSGIFYQEKGYQGGRKLSSSVMWGLGFRKKMIIYRPLAELFGIQEDNVTYFLHGDPTRTLVAFAEAFGRCLGRVLEEGE